MYAPHLTLIVLHDPPIAFFLIFMITTDQEASAYSYFSCQLQFKVADNRTD